ncbi:MAG TPA: TIGR03086 family metal-binding protein [Streptosporangiaceae bacterium]|jgi:uncharacterized protein (TIGR03086 family)|nr:TIGR03086 family metal-binding protein [Streptosporangiaceae bacterium]
MENKNLSAEMAAASAEAARVVGNVPQRALDTPTPCGDWDLRTLLNHTILWTSYSAERRAHGESVAEDLMNKDFTADPGFREDYARQIDKAVTAWSAPEAWEGTRNVMGDATPAADVGAMLLMETALHGWDVARATGQQFSVDDTTANALEDIVQAQAELFRKYQGFADAVEPAENATAFERALTLSGRDPNWKPTSKT